MSTANATASSARPSATRRTRILLSPCHRPCTRLHGGCTGPLPVDVDLPFKLAPRARARRDPRIDAPARIDVWTPRAPPCTAVRTRATFRPSVLHEYVKVDVLLLCLLRTRLYVRILGATSASPSLLHSYAWTSNPKLRRMYSDRPRPRPPKRAPPYAPERAIAPCALNHIWGRTFDAPHSQP